MDVVSVCPLPVDSVVWQPRSSSWVLTFVCKATYTLRPGESVLAQEQEAPLSKDEHWNDDTARSIRAPCDLLPVKPRPEVMLVGSAFAPGGASTRAVTVRLIVGDVDKSIDVFCDRVFTLDGALQEGAPFKRLSLVYERASGGPGTSNPVGIRQDVRDAYGRRALPNLQPAGMHVMAPDDFIEPVGFGPIAPKWPTRAEKLGRHAEAFLLDEWSRHPLPD
ncbi:MAG: DUF2169 domain-containing protein, partial [Zoogloea sp.]|nr:DUF2169 domain-containing protein [Zoogloea sp.]